MPSIARLRQRADAVRDQCGAQAARSQRAVSWSTSGAIVSATDVAGIVGFYTLYYDHAAGKRRMQICTDLPCALRGAEAFAQGVCQKLGVKLGQTTKDGEWTVEAVMCLAGCDKAPMFQVQDANGIHYHESAAPDQPMTVEQALRVLAGYTNSGKGG